MITLIYGSMGSGKTGTAKALGYSLNEIVIEVRSQEELEMKSMGRTDGIFVCNSFYPEERFLPTRPVYMIHCDKRP